MLKLNDISVYKDDPKGKVSRRCNFKGTCTGRRNRVEMELNVYNTTDYVSATFLRCLLSLYSPWIDLAFAEISVPCCCLHTHRLSVKNDGKYGEQDGGRKYRKHDKHILQANSMNPRSNSKNKYRGYDVASHSNGDN